jgi:hypothetical protein
MGDGATPAKIRLAGGCQCGAVRYALSAMPKGTLCHCRMCQKAVGGPFAALATTDLANLTWTRGKPAIFESSSIALRGFCSKCGTPLTYQGLDRSKIDITTGSLDTPNAVELKEIFGAESRVAWLDAVFTLPAHETEAKFSGVISKQHPDHDT